MNHRQLAQVGLGLLGVWALLSAVETFIEFAALAGASIARVALAEVIPVALLLGLSYLLLFHNAQAAAALFPNVDASAEEVPPGLARTLIALMGVFLLIQATPTALNVVLNYFFAADVDLAARRTLIPRLLTSFIPIVASCYLVARPGRLLEFLERPPAGVVATEE